MQLFLILVLLLLGGKRNARELLDEVKPVLEDIGGEEVKEAIKNAEEISEVLSAVQNFANSGGFGKESEQNSAPHEETEYGRQSENYDESVRRSCDNAKYRANSDDNNTAPAIAFPLAPISDIADGEILACLAKYISSQKTA